MPGQRQWLGVAATICIVGLCSTPARPEAPERRRAAASSVAADVLELTNHQRAIRGYGRLRANARLTRAAQIHADQMARARRLAHALPDATYPRAEDRLAAADYRWRSFGENLALGQSGAEAAVESWMDSRGHRRNILNPDFTELGVGYAIDGVGRPYFVQVFGSPAS